MTQKNYVLGFCFNRDKTQVLLINKEKPQWQKGKINGVGGKVEPEDVSPMAAMIREFKEETGIDTREQANDTLRGWHHFATMIFKNDVMGGAANVYCFRIFSNSVYKYQTAETEEVELFNLEPGGVNNLRNMYECNIIKNLRVLIPMALDEDFIFAELDIK